MHPLERMINLVALLLESRFPIPFERIREELPAYSQKDLAASKRMFERDKEILRDLGIPIELEPTDGWGDDEGYTIPKDAYYLPEISFTPEEISALFVAASSPGKDTEAEQALRKLAAGAEEGNPRDASPLLASEAGAADALTDVAAAIGNGKSIRFDYRAASGEVSVRSVDAYALVHRAGQWYVVGMDRDRGEIRSFRLSRMASSITEGEQGAPAPEGFEARSHVAPGPWAGATKAGVARLAFSPRVAWWATRGIAGVQVAETREDGWIEVELPLAGDSASVSWIASFGPDAIVLSPEDLEQAVVTHLRESRASL
ncbi:MAG: WYL domain-containing protein [Actinomycetota bacterium]